MTGHWSAQGWQGWGGASESEGRGQVHVEASKPHPTPLSDIIQVSQLTHLKKCHVTLNLLSQGGLPWAHHSFLGTQKTTPTSCTPYPLSVSASSQSWPQLSFSEVISALMHRSLAHCPSVHPGSMIRNKLRGHKAFPSVSPHPKAFVGQDLQRAPFVGQYLQKAPHPPHLA